jgi:uncharacterized membrane-anchored protein
MNRVGEMIARIPKAAFYSAAAVIQVLLVFLMVADRMQVLRNGTEVTLQTRAIDPRDILRGDYVALGYDIASVPTAGLSYDIRRGATVFVKIAPKADGSYEATSAHLSPVAVVAPEILLRGRIQVTCFGARGGCERMNVRYGLERYFVPQGEGRKIESARNAGRVAVVAAVTSNGRSAIKRLLVDGKPVYDEPLF